MDKNEIKKTAENILYVATAIMVLVYTIMETYQELFGAAAG